MIRNVQALRAVAAYMVVIHHLRDYLRTAAGVDIKTHVGEAGVDIFFAISGFIMVVTTSESMKPGTFMWRRFVRIVPFYWAMTLAVYAVAVVAPSALGTTQARPDMLLKSLLFIPFEKTPSVIMPLLYVGWTLNFEMFFYLVFALTMAVCAAGPRRILWLGVILGSLVVLGRVVDFTFVPAAFFTNPLLIEFLAGCCFGQLFLHLRRIGARPKLLGILALALGVAGLFAFVAFGPESPGPLAPLRPLYWGVPCLSIVVGAVLLELAGYATTSRLLLSQGDASYSVYLVHLFVLQLAAKVLAKFLVGQSWVGLLVAVLLVVLVGAVGRAVHLFVERPLNELFRRFQARFGFA